MAQKVIKKQFCFLLTKPTHSILSSAFFLLLLSTLLFSIYLLSSSLEQFQFPNKQLRGRDLVVVKTNTDTNYEVRGNKNCLQNQIQKFKPDFDTQEIFPRLDFYVSN